MTQTVKILEQLFTLSRETFVLRGIVSRPEQLSEKAPLIIMPNSGLVHHVGTCRSSVRFCRSLASHDCIAVRVDLSNLGDSMPRHDFQELNDEQRTIQELKAVIDDMLYTYGPRPVVVYGLCSGSQNGFKLAVEDERVVGLFGVDHFGFRNWSYYLLHYARQCFRLEPWMARFGRLMNKRIPQTAEDFDFGEGEFEWQYPPKSQVEDGYRTLVGRGVLMHYIYTGDWRSEFNHRRQFFLMHRSVAFNNCVTIQYRPEMSHILAEPSSQNYVEQQLLAFVLKFLR